MKATNKERILQRVKKCLALSESDNEHEAANALRQAHAMMQKYNISMSDAEKIDYAILDASLEKRAKGNYSQIEMILYSVVCGFFGCTLFLRKNWPVVVGESPAPEIADYAAKTLLTQLRQNRADAMQELEKQHFRELTRSEKIEFNKVFTLSWTNAVREKIQDFAQSVTEDKKTEHCEAVEEYWGMKVATRKNRAITTKNSRITSYAWQQGEEGGSKAQLNHGVNAGQGQARIAS